MAGMNDRDQSNVPESERVTDVDRQEWGPTEPDEMAVLSRLYDYDPETGTFSAHVGD